MVSGTNSNMLLLKKYMLSIHFGSFSISQYNSHDVRPCLAGLRLLSKWLQLWLLWWSGFSSGAGAVFRERLAKRLLLVV
jgi:hypothetical protein